MLEDLVHGALAGIAVGGFVAAMVNVNIIAVKALLRFNHMAVTTAWNMHINLEQAQRHRERERALQQLQQLQAETEDEDEDEDEETES